MNNSPAKEAETHNLQYSAKALIIFRHGLFFFRVAHVKNTAWMFGYPAMIPNNKEYHRSLGKDCS